MLKKLKSFFRSLFGFICQPRLEKKESPQPWNKDMLKGRLREIAEERGLKFNKKVTKVVLINALKESEKQ